MNTLRPTCKILTARLCRSGLAAGVKYPDRTTGSEIAAKTRSKSNKWSKEKRATLFDRGMQIIYGGAFIFLLTFISGCSTNGRYADGLDHWPVQTISVDSGSN
jgi:hypothetical protein